MVSWKLDVDQEIVENTRERRTGIQERTSMNSQTEVKPMDPLEEGVIHLIIPQGVLRQGIQQTATREAQLATCQP